MTPIRLLAADLDGTLLDSRWNLSDVNCNALREAHACGVQIVSLITATNHEDGVAKAITRFILRNPSQIPTR